MNTYQATSSQVSSSLRARTADFFKMDVPRSVSSCIPRDTNPLRRTLTHASSLPVWESNENMCLGLWQLMSRC